MTVGPRLFQIRQRNLPGGKPRSAQPVGRGNGLGSIDRGWRDVFSAMPAFSRCRHPLRSAPSLDGHHTRSDKFSERLNFRRLQMLIWAGRGRPAMYTSHLSPGSGRGSFGHKASPYGRNKDAGCGVAGASGLQATPSRCPHQQPQVTGAGGVNGPFVCRFPSRLRPRAGS
jgi:hypothetical protein